MKEESLNKGKRVYLACPLFSKGERDFNLLIAKILEDYGYDVFLPQRDGFLAPELAGLNEEEKIKKIFKKDYDEVAKADILFAILDGRSVDEGLCVELGMAYVLNKRCYGFKTDARQLENDLMFNPMITGCFKKIIFNLDGDKAIDELKEYLDNNEL